MTTIKLPLAIYIITLIASVYFAVHGQYLAAIFFAIHAVGYNMVVAISLAVEMLAIKITIKATQEDPDA